MTRLAILSTILLALSAAPSAAANCFWSNGVYLCKDRSGRTYVAKPRGDKGVQRRPQGTVRAPTYYPPSDIGRGMGAFTYGCTFGGCD
jgi:hypothetical protein